MWSFLHKLLAVLCPDDTQRFRDRTSLGMVVASRLHDNSADRMTIIRRSIAQALLGTVWLATGVAPASAANILLLLADDMGVDQVGAYAEGAAPAKTPQIDALAANGVLFRNAWSNPLCSPSRALIQTGRYAYRTGVVNAAVLFPRNALSVRETTIAEVLRPVGYRCGLFGKWHLGDSLNVGGKCSPNLAGWGNYAGSLIGQLDDYYQWEKVANCLPTTSRRYATSVNVDDALAWIDRNRRDPWCCVVAFNAPHTPYHSPPDSLHTVDLTGLDSETTPIPFAKAMIEAMDAEIGRLLLGLGSERDETTILFTGDNGTNGPVVEAPFDPARAKGTVYEGGVNVPLIVSGQGVASPGREVASLVSLVDLFATVAELAGTTSTTGVDSVSLVPYLLDPQAQPRRSTVYCEVYGDPVSCQVYEASPQGCQRAIRNLHYKLVQHLGAMTTEELYNLATDPFEQVDLLEQELSADAQNNYAQLKAALPPLRADDRRRRTVP